MSWIGLKITSVQVGNLRKSDLFLANGPFLSGDAVHFRMIEFMQEELGTKKTTKRYQLSEGSDSSPYLYSIANHRQDGQTFSHDEFTAAGAAITPKIFSDFYQTKIVDQLIKNLNTLLANFPLRQQ
jgi:hypothetical protein